MSLELDIHSPKIEIPSNRSPCPWAQHLHPTRLESLKRKRKRKGERRKGLQEQKDERGLSECLSFGRLPSTRGLSGSRVRDILEVAVREKVFVEKRRKSHDRMKTSALRNVRRAER